MRKYAPINIVVHYPKTEQGMAELARRVAEVHADAVDYKLKRLNCPTSQKIALLEAVIQTVKQKCRNHV